VPAAVDAASDQGDDVRLDVCGGILEKQWPMPLGANLG
jgi:hypothetical protein